MKPPLLRALLLALLAAPLALVGCQTETEVEREPDGGVEIERRPGIDEAEVERSLEEAGETLREGAEDAGEAIREGIQDAAETIDENVDLGDNAGTPEEDR